MTEHQLPAYLQNRAVQNDFTDYAADGIGSMLPPHVSIRGNFFTLIDAAGQEFQPMPVMDAVIVDRSTVTCKMYFGKPWTPGSEEPPMCWSTNGIGPSRDAVSPQARTCAECDKNVRGSAVSAISGAAVKACRDEYHLAILLPTMPGMMFRYVLTPGSFKNWQAYVGKFKNSNVKMSMVVTRLSFTPKVNGEVAFESISYIDEATNNIVQKALIEKATDVLCGRLDTPRVAALVAPDPQYVAPPNTTGQAPLLSTQEGSTLQVQPSAPFVGAASAAASPSTATTQPSFNPAPVQHAQTTSPSDPAPAGRRRRRTAAEMQQANGQASVAQAPQPGGVAPFPHPSSPAASTGQAPQFGIAQGQPAAANPELATMLDDFFKS